MVRITSIRTGMVGDFIEDVVLISSDTRLEKWRLQISYSIDGKNVYSGYDTGSPIKLTPWRIGMARVKIPRTELQGKDIALLRREFFVYAPAGNSLAVEDCTQSKEEKRGFFRRLFG